MKFTFKTEKPTGKWKSFEPDHHLIKLKRKECGNITDAAPHVIRFSIKREPSKTHPAPFHYVTLKKKFDSLDGAKSFLVENTDKIVNQFNLHFFEP